MLTFIAFTVFRKCAVRNIQIFFLVIDVRAGDIAAFLEFAAEFSPLFCKNPLVSLNISDAEIWPESARRKNLYTVYRNQQTVISQNRNHS